MGKRKAVSKSPGKGGIGHKIKKVKNGSNPLKSLKSFGCKKISDFLNENSSLTSSKNTLIANSKKKPNIVERRVLGEVGNIGDTDSNKIEEPALNNSKEEYKEESDFLHEINAVYEKYKMPASNNSEGSDKNSTSIVVDAEEVENDPEMEGLCEYEKIRLRNIRERQQMFAQLQIEEAKKMCSPSTAEKPSKPQKRVLKPKENLAPRKSLRIAGGVPEIDRFSASFDDNPVDKELISRPRRSLPANCNDYLHATRTYTGDERPDGLTPVAEGRFKILQVPKKCTIKQFVLSNGLEFKCGRGFYEFTKPEIISHRKEVVLIEKSSGKMFTGRDACRMIGGNI